MLVRLIGAMGLYRHHLPTLLASAAMSVGVHSMFTVGVFLLGCGLYEHVHPLATQFVMNPLSAVTGVLPLPMGPFEAVLDLLYAAVPLPGGKPMALGQGLVVALAYRIVTVLIAAVGIGYYLGSRAEVADVLHQSQAESREPAAAEQALAAG